MVLPVERWHARAKLARDTAAQMENDAERAFMLLYAAECERMADQCLLGFPPGEDPPRAAAVPAAGGPSERAFERQSNDGRLLELYRYWQERRGGRRFPARKDLDPLDFPIALGRVSLIEVRREPLTFHYRLVSTHLTEHLGYEMTGKTVDAIPDPAMREFTRAFYERVLGRAEPTYETGSVVISGFRWWHETLALPLAADGETIDMLLVYRNTERPFEIPSVA